MAYGSTNGVSSTKDYCAMRHCFEPLRTFSGYFNMKPSELGSRSPGLFIELLNIGLFLILFSRA